MVNVAKRIFLVVGKDFLQRQHAIENIRKKVLPHPSCLIDTFVFYPHEIDLKGLWERCVTFSFDKEKILIFKDADRISSEVKEFLQKGIAKIVSANYLIFESEEDLLSGARKKDVFFRELARQAAVVRVGSPSARPVTLEDFKWSFRKRDVASALAIVERLFNEQGRDLSPLILGILVYECMRTKDLNLRKRYFSFLWEADREMKEKGLNGRLVIERLVMKLFSS
jgi:hypothetical protein